MSHAVTVRPIRTDDDLTAALERAGQIINARRGTAEGDELDVLSTLIVAYEREHEHFEPLSPIETIRYTLKRKGLKEKDLVPYIGSPSRVSDVLSGRRRLNIAMIEKLHAGLGIPFERLIVGP
jgi:HTH-type transcriptional regulator/antitoxin HigA